MPFGEMTITLDDVACLLHLPVRGDFYTPISVTMEEVVALAAELLGVTYEFAFEETSQQRGEYFTQQWLYECYQRNVNLYGRFDCAARAYMLMLVGCTICTDKSYTRVDAKWLPMFTNLSACHRFSWASVALVCLYDNLNDASNFTTKSLTGYATLLRRGKSNPYAVPFLLSFSTETRRSLFHCPYQANPNLDLMGTPETLREPCPVRVLYDTGMAFGMGAVGGSAFHFSKGLYSSPKGARFIGATQAVGLCWIFELA
ncbi:unnamed protein product [Trifolium pratense]|uniref:Uncharacterized protein n=1 Tax=Trifolium pratense TaxID=57577 RepID=A0ACB0JF79_TRIPR|nr:unnamed protein product [Trifolium pratense]